MLGTNPVVEDYLLASGQWAVVHQAHYGTAVTRCVDQRRRSHIEHDMKVHAVRHMFFRCLVVFAGLEQLQVGGRDKVRQGAGRRTSQRAQGLLSERPTHAGIVHAFLVLPGFSTLTLVRFTTQCFSSISSGTRRLVG